MYDDEQTKTDLSKVELAGVPYRAVVLTDTFAVGDDLFVTIPQLDSDEDPQGLHSHGPCLGWDAHSDSTTPSRGDDALVFVDDTGDYWISAWSPA